VAIGAEAGNETKQEDNGKDAVKLPESEEGLKAELSQVLADLRANSESIDALRTAAMDIRGSLEQLSSSRQLTQEALQSALQAVGGALDNLHKADAKTPLSRSLPVFRAVEDRLDDLQRLTAEPLEALEGMLPRQRYRENVTPAQRLIESVFQKRPRPEVRVYRVLSAVNAIRFQSDGVTREQMGPAIDAARTELGRLSPAEMLTMIGADLKDARSWAEGIAAELDKMIAELQRRAMALSAKKDAIDKALIASRIAYTKTEGQITDKLINAVYFMIGSIAFLFIVLLVMSKLHSETCKLLIEERTLNEILSMGFLIVAIIVLGAGNKIQAETLGTLLGTIAGYLFGKKIADIGSQPRRDQRDARATVGSPGTEGSSSTKPVTSTSAAGDAKLQTTAGQ
jgi:hypothetical protein